jgi:hypothetical protein
MSGETQIYVIRSESGHFKVGTTNDIKRRLSYLQTGSPVRLWVEAIGPGTRCIEKEWHTRLDGYYVRGEWFFADSRVIEAVAVMVRDGIRPKPLRTSPRLRIRVTETVGINDVGALGLKCQIECALRRRDVNTVQELTQLSRDTLLSMRGIGVTAVFDIAEKLNARGLKLAAGRNIALLKRKGMAA